jgi:aminoglycoside phosphotransferase (APT) family kinase protein
VKAPGPLLASGRDADIFEYGPGLVLRRSRENRKSMLAEAKTMQYLRDRGYPVPAVEEVSEDGTELVMERVDGPSMVAAISRAPWTVRRQGRVLADLHRQLHEIPCPEFLAPAPVGGIGDRILHLDLHPLNVIISRRGPVVIDWPNARTGDPNTDIAVAWALLFAGEIPGGGLLTKALGVFRNLLVEGFLSGFDRAKVAAMLGDVVEWKARDAHMSEGEVDRMRSLVRRQLRSA